MSRVRIVGGTKQEVDGRVWRAIIGQVVSNKRPDTSKFFFFSFLFDNGRFGRRLNQFVFLPKSPRIFILEGFLFMIPGGWAGAARTMLVLILVVAGTGANESARNSFLTFSTTLSKVVVAGVLTWPGRLTTTAFWDRCANFRGAGRRLACPLGFGLVDGGVRLDLVVGLLGPNDARTTRNSALFRCNAFLVGKVDSKCYSSRELVRS